RGAFEQALKLLGHVDIDISVGVVVAIEEDDGGFAFSEDVVCYIVAGRVDVFVAIGPDDCKDACIVTAADQILRDDEIVAGIVEDAGARAAALTWCARL